MSLSAAVCNVAPQGADWIEMFQFVSSITYYYGLVHPIESSGYIYKSLLTLHEISRNEDFCLIVLISIIYGPQL